MEISKMADKDDKLTSLKARQWLYAYAKKNDLKITEFRSDDGSCFAHVEDCEHKSSTAVANEPTIALMACFMSFLDKRMHFLEESK